MSMRPSAAPASDACTSRARAVCERRRVLPHADAAAAAVAVSLRRARLGAVRGHLRAAVVPITRAEMRPARASRPRDLRARRTRSSTLVELGPGSGEKLATLLEAGRGPRRRLDRPSRRRLAGGARPRGARARRARRRRASCAHQATYEAGLAEAVAEPRGAGRHADAVPRIEHRQLRSARRRRVPAQHSRGARRRRRAAHRHRSRQAGSATCCWPTTIRSASPRPSTAICSCASTASSAATSTSTRSTIARCGTRRSRASRCTSSPDPSSTCASARHRSS